MSRTAERQNRAWKRITEILHRDLAQWASEQIVINGKKPDATVPAVATYIEQIIRFEAPAYGDAKALRARIVEEIPALSATIREHTYDLRHAARQKPQPAKAG